MSVCVVNTSLRSVSLLIMQAAMGFKKTKITLQRSNSAQLRCFENGNDDFGVEAFWIGDAARVGYFVPLNGPLNGHSPSCN